MATATTQKQRSGRRAARSTEDALAILKADHQEVEKLFVSFGQAGDRAYKTKRRLVDQMIEALSVHAFIEEQVLYPAAQHDVASAGDDVLEALEEHHIVKWELQELLDLDPTDERFTAKVTVLAENVRHHVREEEKELFPLLRSKLPKARLQELGGPVGGGAGGRTPSSPPPPSGGTARPPPAGRRELGHRPDPGGRAVGALGVVGPPCRLWTGRRPDRPAGRPTGRTTGRRQAQGRRPVKSSSRRVIGASSGTVPEGPVPKMPISPMNGAMGSRLS